MSRVGDRPVIFGHSGTLEPQRGSLEQGHLHPIQPNIPVDMPDFSWVKMHSQAEETSLATANIWLPSYPLGILTLTTHSLKPKPLQMLRTVPDLLPINYCLTVQ